MPRCDQCHIQWSSAREQRNGFDPIAARQNDQVPQICPTCRARQYRPPREGRQSSAVFNRDDELLQSLFDNPAPEPARVPVRRAQPTPVDMEVTVTVAGKQVAKTRVKEKPKIERIHQTRYDLLDTDWLDDE